MSDIKSYPPGSEEAEKLGCTCPVMDNHYGAGFQYGSEGTCYWINGDCSLHAKNEDKRKVKD